MAKNEKTFPIRMDNKTYHRLETQANRFGVSVTAYIRQACVYQLENDEASMQSFTDHRGNGSDGGKVQTTKERPERQETDTEELSRSPANLPVRSWFDRLTAGGRKE